MLTRKILYIDLTNRVSEAVPVDPDLRRNFLGGRGMNMHFLSAAYSPELDPLSPENPLLFGTGMLTGALGFGSRINISARSPENGHLGDSNMGGDFGAEMVRAGFCQLVISGRSEEPVYLFLKDGRVEFKHANQLWGCDTLITQRQIRRELNDDRVQIACIGQAGENLVRFASIRSGRKNAAGRTGMGAVMGSKNLKAVAARGMLDLRIADPEALLTFHRRSVRGLMKTKWAQALSRQGTPLLFQYANAMGFLSYCNHQYTSVGEKGRSLHAEALEPYSTGMLSCHGCPVHCRHRYSISEGIYQGSNGEGPEYASIGSLGPKIGNLDLENIIHSTELCNLYGLDTISTGSYIAWAMELYQRGIIDRKITEIPLVWGDPESVPEIIHRIARRQGIGDLLAEGRLAADVFGAPSVDYLLEVKRFPLEMTDERLPKSFALGMATATRGACHMRSRPSIDVLGLPQEVLRRLYGGPVGSEFASYEGKGRMVWWHELHNAVSDSLGFCRFLTVFSSPHGVQYRDFCRWILLCTDLSLTPKELRAAGERIYTLERTMLVKEGFSRKDDTLPRRYFEEPVQEGPARGSVIDADAFQGMLDQYYRLHGWDRNGVPRRRTLLKLGLV